MYKLSAVDAGFLYADDSSINNQITMTQVAPSAPTSRTPPTGTLPRVA